MYVRGLDHSWSLNGLNGLGTFSCPGGYGCFRGLCFEVLQLNGCLVYFNL